MKSKKTSGIYYDTNKNRYVVSYYLTDNKIGKKKRVRKSFITKQDAEDFHKELQYRKGNSIFIKNNGIPLSELMKFLIERKLQTNLVAEQQYGKVMKIISKIEKEEIGKKDISEITSEELQNFFNSLTHYSNGYMQKFIIQFSQAFKYAQNKGYIRLNPMTDTYTPKSIKSDKIVRAMEIEEQQILTTYLKSKTLDEEPYKNVYLIQLYAGLRVGEALALRNSDIDLKNKIIHINKTLTRDADEKVIMGNSTKTFSGKRDVPIQDIIFNEIKEQMEVSKNNFDGQLFLSSNGNYANPRNVNTSLKRILIQTCGITDITTHSLRHTYGTRCIESGMPPVVVQRLMGHKDIGVTLNTYTSVLNKFKEEELKKLNSYYQDNHLYNEKTSEKER